MRHCLRPTMAIYAAFVAAYIPQFATSQQDKAPPRARELEIGIGNSDEYATSVVTVQAPESSLGIGASDHAKITAILASARDLMENAGFLVENESTAQEGKDMMALADAKFREVQDRILHINELLTEQENQPRGLLRNKYSDHDVKKTQQEVVADEERALDVSRSMYLTATTFPQCVERLLDDCRGLINRDLRKLRLGTVEMVIHEKRNHHQANYNKVVIVANELADRVVGRTGDGIVTYPYNWDDSLLGERALGVDGKWNCLTITPAECCTLIQDSAPNVDVQGNNLLCHIFIPFGGIGNQKHSNRVFINLSSDHRVHEAPFIS